MKPCPFCGGESVHVVVGTLDREGYPSQLACDDCGAGGPWMYCHDPHNSDLHKLEKLWDTRVKIN